MSQRTTASAARLRLVCGSLRLDDRLTVRACAGDRAAHVAMAAAAASKGGSSGAGAAEMDETMEEKLVNEEYKIWKKNTPFLCVTPSSHSRLPAYIYSHSHTHMRAAHAILKYTCTLAHTAILAHTVHDVRTHTFSYRHPTPHLPGTYLSAKLPSPPLSRQMMILPHRSPAPPPSLISGHSAQLRPCDDACAGVAQPDGTVVAGRDAP